MIGEMAGSSLRAVAVSLAISRPTYGSIVSLRVCTECGGQREDSGRGVQLHSSKGTYR